MYLPNRSDNANRRAAVGLNEIMYDSTIAWHIENVPKCSYYRDNLPHIQKHSAHSVIAVDHTHFVY